MTYRTLALLLTFPLLCLAAQAAHAQTRNCGPHALVVERLAEIYKESRQAIALSGPATVLEVFASADTGTWTITVTRAGGDTCIVASGENFQLVSDALPLNDEPA